MNLPDRYKKFASQIISEPVSRNEKVLFVDGLNSYIRCFAATPTMNDDGDHVGGVTGFLKSLGMIIRQQKPSRVVCVFDGKGGSQKRRQIFPDYKGNRKTFTKLNRSYNFENIETEQNSMKWQLILLINLLTYLPVTVIAPDNVEADDSIAYLAQYVQELGGKSIIVSTDKDFLQLVTDKITVWNPIKKKMYNTNMVIEDYAIHPRNFLLYRMVTGDKSDNVDGVKGIGATTLIKHFPDLIKEERKTIDDVIEIAKSKPKVVACQKICESKEILERNMKLMSLDDVQMSSATKINILDQFENEIPPLNKLGLTKICLSSKLIQALGNYDEWITSTYVPLMRYRLLKKETE